MKSELSVDLKIGIFFWIIWKWAHFLKSGRGKGDSSFNNGRSTLLTIAGFEDRRKS